MANHPNRSRLTVEQARQCARDLIASVEGRQWNMDTVGGCLPSGWYLSEHAAQDDWHPVTVAHLARQYRQYARRDY